LNEVRREKSLLEKRIENEKVVHASLEEQLECLRDKHIPVAETLEEEEEIEQEG
jgi:hypothetical protein